MRSQLRLTYIRRPSRISCRQPPPPVRSISKLQDQKEPEILSSSPPPPSKDPTPSLHRQPSSVKVSSTNEELLPRPKTSIITSSIDQLSAVTSDIMNSDLKSKQQQQQQFDHWTSKQKTMLKLAAVLLVLVIVSAAVIPSVYFLVFQQPSKQSSSFSNLTASICSTTTCIGKETPYRTTMATFVYPFDGNTNDLSGYGTGVPFGTSTLAYTGSCYVGTSALNLNSPSNFQYVQTPYVDLRQSFTIEAWVYPATTTPWSEYGLFSQCDANFTCISITIRNNRIIFTLDSMNNNITPLMSSTLIILGDWTHIAAVYDATLSQSLIYINGRLDALSSYFVTSYKGTSLGSTTTIGRSLTNTYNYTYFIGRIDHFTVSAGIVRSTCQIINDASLLVYFPFNSQTIYNDYSVNLFNGITQTTTTINHGPIGEALYFPTNSSYFQSKCFSNPEYTSPPFTISLWINPDSLGTGGSLVHTSNWQNGSGAICYDLLVLTSTGAIVAQVMSSGSGFVNATQGPIIPAHTWTHITMVFSFNYGVRLYINGQLATVSIGISMTTWSFTEPQYITLGNTSPLGPSSGVTCKVGTIPVVSGAFQGGIDEFRLYNRELENQEICVLANR